MAAAFVKAANGYFGNTTSATATFGSATTTGNAILVAVVASSAASTISTPTDNASNTYTPIGTQTAGSNFVCRMFYCLNATGHAGLQVTATVGTAQYGYIACHEVSGIATSDALDQQTGQVQGTVDTTTDAVTSGSVTTTEAGEYIFGCTTPNSFVGTLCSAGTDFTSDAQLNDSGMTGRSEYRVQTSAGSIAATFTAGTTGLEWITKIATFKAAVTGQYARPNAVVQAQNWDGFINGVDQNDQSNLDNYIDETTADDTDSIRSGAGPSNDTCTLNLSTISTPGAGTVTMRIRARFL